MASFALNYQEQIIDEIKHTPKEFLPDVLQILKVFRHSVSFETAEETFKQGMKETLRGEIFPIDTLWDDMDD